MTPLPIFIGYDPREHAAYEVACRSIIKRSSKPVLITPLYLPHLTHILTRHIKRSETGHLWCPISEAPMSTEFTISRFCVPFIQEDGWALFTDCDILCLNDIASLFAEADDKYAVMVVKHTHEPNDAIKMGDQIQTNYYRKNWSSVVLWNCSHFAHRRLTRDRLNNWLGRDLHAFKWLKDEEIGELPFDWNLLIGVEPYVEGASLLHFTNGGPWLPGWQGGMCDDIWIKEQRSSVNA